MRALKARMRATVGSADRGLTLTEVLISMLLFSFVIVISGMAVVNLARASTDARMRSESATNVLLAYQSLDRQIRYASSINFPGVAPSGASYIEFIVPRGSRSPNVDGSDPTHDLCVQWRYIPSSGTLQTRQWEATASPSLPTFATRATLIETPASATYPFTMIPAKAGGAVTQSLRLVLEAGGANEKSRTKVNTQLVARNSSLGSPSNADANNDGQSDTPVCLPSGARS
ncbi:type II secretion system protein [Salinibacterium sp. ZJ77]|uniref:PulJ/GspJ family protein n=1 Tax=Salinibacterium sp. ZJ77 TaxID=2708337 RepID=UPI00142014B2|nr:type II secretion system protein [Salinibacterium sp. ZJ77]